MCVLDEGGYHRRGRGSFGVDLGHPVASNGDFVAWLRESDLLFPNYFGEDLFVLLGIPTFLFYLHMLRFYLGKSCTVTS